MRLFAKKKIWLRLLIADLVLAVLALAFLAVCFGLRGTLRSQKAAERFGADSELAFSQFSVFHSSRDNMSLNDVYSFRQALMDKLTEASVEIEAPGRPFIDAWCAFGEENVAGDRGNADVNVVAVGGDWFFFHPLRIKTGAYIWEDDVMDDFVVLDRELAWRLFGGDDLIGLTLNIRGQPFRIAGVIERDTDFASKKAREEGNVLYMSYRAYNVLQGEQAAAIDCYELVMPQPVKGFGESLFKEKFPLGGGDLINNSQRFSLGGIWSVVKEFGTRSMHRSSVIYPEWENAARCVGDWCALFLFLAVVCVTPPVVSFAVVFLVSLVRLKDLLQKKVPELASDALDRSRTRRWEKKHPKQPEP